MPVSPKVIERTLGEIADQLDKLRADKAKTEKRRRAWLAKGVVAGIPYRQLGDWSRVSNPRVHQIVGPKPEIIAAAEAAS
jgi:hypothetical protein